MIDQPTYNQLKRQGMLDVLEGEEVGKKKLSRNQKLAIGAGAGLAGTGGLYTTGLMSEGVPLWNVPQVLKQDIRGLGTHYVGKARTPMTGSLSPIAETIRKGTFATGRGIKGIGKRAWLNLRGAAAGVRGFSELNDKLDEIITFAVKPAKFRSGRLMEILEQSGAIRKNSRGTIQHAAVAMPAKKGREATMVISKPTLDFKGYYASAGNWSKHDKGPKVTDEYIGKVAKNHSELLKALRRKTTTGSFSSWLDDLIEFKIPEESQARK